MENLLFDNNIKVTVSQSPTDPTMGDDVTFTANVFFSRPSDEYGVPNTYFFSYTWLVSNDGGNNFYQVGSDLEELVIYNIDQTFFNNIYKVKVALIDLNNIILTEDGNNLTTQFGEILLGNTNASSLSIQTTTNNSSVTNISPIGNSPNIEALDILNLDSIIGEAAVFDTTITPETSAEALSGQITLDRFGNSQTIAGAPLTLTPIEELPDPIIETELNQQNILSGTKFFAKNIQLAADCDTRLSYDVCVPASNGIYNNLKECLDSGACTNDDMITISTTNFDPSSRDPISIGVDIGKMPNYFVLKRTNYAGQLLNMTDIDTRTGCCAGNLIELCPFEIKTGNGECEGDDLDTYKAPRPLKICKDSSIRVPRKKYVLIDAIVEANNSRVFKDNDCGCNKPSGAIPHKIALKPVYNDDGSYDLIAESESFIQPLPETDSPTGIGSIPNDLQILAGNGGAIGFVEGLLRRTIGRFASEVGWRQAAAEYISRAAATRAAEFAAQTLVNQAKLVAPRVVGVAATAGETILGTVALGVALVPVALGLGYSLGYSINYVGQSIWIAMFCRDRNGIAAPIFQIECTNTIFQQVYKCIDSIYRNQDNSSQYITCNVVGDSSTGRITSYESLHPIPIPYQFTPEYTCECITDSSSYIGQIEIKKWTTDDLLSQGLSLDDIERFDYQCHWYVTKHIGKPGSRCTCRLTNSPHTLIDNFITTFFSVILSGPSTIGVANAIKNDTTIRPTYTFSIPGFDPNKFTVDSSPDIRDCIKATEFSREFCRGGCDGFYCCDSMRTYVYEVVPVGEDTFVCSVVKNIPPPNTCPGASTVRFDRCNTDSTVTIPVALYRINKKLKDCSDEVDNTQICVNEGEAEAVIKHAIGPQGVAVVYRYEERDSRDPADISQIAPPIMDGDVEVVPALYKHAKYVFKTAYKLSSLNNPCDACKILYTVTEDSGDYPCDDRNINRDEFCGWSAGCYISNSTDSTPYKKAIITQKTHPTQSDINNITNDYRSGGFYDDFGRAMSDAEALISPRGIVISSPCPPR